MFILFLVLIIVGIIVMAISVDESSTLGMALGAIILASSFIGFVVKLNSFMVEDTAKCIEATKYKIAQKVFLKGIDKPMIVTKSVCISSTRGIIEYTLMNDDGLVVEAEGENISSER